MSAGSVFYAKLGNAYVLRFVGDIRYTLGCALDEFLDRLFERRDFDNILIDLREATSIDSTSLGLLARVANFQRGEFGKRTTIVSTNADINETLDSVGFDQVFSVCHDPDGCPPAHEPLRVSPPSPTELSDTMYEAHRLLSDLNERNRNAFRDVLDLLKESAGRKR